MFVTQAAQSANRAVRASKLFYQSKTMVALHRSCTHSASQRSFLPGIPALRRSDARLSCSAANTQFVTWIPSVAATKSGPAVNDPEADVERLVSRHP